MTQTLFSFHPPETPAMSEYLEYCKTDIGRKSVDFDRRNPHVGELFIRYSEQAFKSGRSRFSSKAIFERLRWDLAFTTDDAEFKISNNHTAYYARKLMAFMPKFDGFFMMREKAS